MTLAHSLNENNVDMLCGSRHQINLETIETLLGKLAAEANLVFFVDAGITDDKKITWLKRQDEKYERAKTALKKIYAGESVQNIAKTRNLPRVTTCLPMLEECARKFGKLFVTVSKECDTELARYATSEKDVLAVLSDDTDFLIFQGHWKYLSIQNLGFGTLETIEYNREALRSFLGVNDDQLAILSTLSGNDLVSYKDLQLFHRKYFHAIKDFPKLARYIKAKWSTLSNNLDSIVSTILRDILKGNHGYSNEHIKNSLLQYDLVRL